MSDTPSGDRRPLLVAVSAVMMVLALVAVVLRFVCRRWTRAALLSDDWFILAALPVAWIQAIMVIWMAKDYHYGLHVSQLVSGDPRGFFRGLYVYQIAYPIDIALIKFSFLAFTWRVFSVKPMKLPVIIITTLVAIWFVAIVLIAIFPCRPIHDFWDMGPGAKCISYLQFYLAQSVYSIITDLMILILPMPFVWRLRISWGQKFGITCIFCIGIFLVLASIIRMVLQVKYISSTDFSWDLVYIGLWSVIEVHAGVVCACLPSMRPLVRLVLYGSFTATTKPYPQRKGYSKESTSQAKKSRSRNESGDTSHDPTFDYLHKSDFQTRIKSVQPTATQLQKERDHTNKPLPQINVQQDVDVDYIELGHLRLATRGRHDDDDVERASEKDLLR